jgi:hypothetical protein
VARVLIGCEFSGIVREEFARMGHDAWSCDLLPSEKPGKHIQGDVLEVLNDGWDLAVFHPPCTYLAKSSAIWLYRNGKWDRDRWKELVAGADFFAAVLDAPIPRVAVENPIMIGAARRRIARVSKVRSFRRQTVEPFWFGMPERKATVLWLRNLPELEPTNMLRNRGYFQRGRDAREWRVRSRTDPYLARAMAQQWGALI